MDNIIEKKEIKKHTKIKTSKYKDIHKKKNINQLDSIKKDILINNKELNKLDILKNIEDLNTFINDIENIENDFKKSLNLENKKKDMKYKIIKNNNFNLDNNDFLDFLSQNDEIINLDFNSIYYGNSTCILNLVNNLFLDSSNKNSQLNINLNMNEYIDNSKDIEILKKIIVNDLNDNVIDNENILFKSLFNILNETLSNTNSLFLKIKCLEKNNDIINDISKFLCDFKNINEENEYCNIFIFIKINGVNKIFKISNNRSLLLKTLNNIDNNENIKILIIGHNVNDNTYIRNNYLIRIYDLYKKIKQKEIITKEIKIPFYKDANIYIFNELSDFIEREKLQSTDDFLSKGVEIKKTIDENEEFRLWNFEFSKKLESSTIDKNTFAPKNNVINQNYLRDIRALRDICKNKLQNNSIISRYYEILDIENRQSLRDLSEYKNYFQSISNHINSLIEDKNKELKKLSDYENQNDKYNILFSNYIEIKPEDKRNLPKKNLKEPRYNPAYNSGYYSR